MVDFSEFSVAIMAKINEYFKAVKKNDCNVRCELLENSQSLSTRFYDDCVQIQLSECTKNECIQIKANLEVQLKNLEQKCENVEEAIKIGKEIISEKNDDIEYLLKQVEAVRESNVVSVNSADPSEEPHYTQKSTVVCDRKLVHATTLKSNSTQKTQEDPQQMFSSYENDINKNQLSYLRSLDPRKDVDSHFINTIVKSLYDGRFDILKNKSVTGRSKPGQTKQAVSPEKHDVMKRMFTERILTATADSVERNERKKRLNKYINDAIRNITKSIDSKELEKQTCQRLTDNFIE